jgi:hypothetical protein
MTYKFSDAVFRSALDFIRTVRSESGDLGSQKVYAMLDAYDPDLRDELVYRLIINDVGSGFRIRRINGAQTDMIAAIKAIRTATGLGLAESKAIIDQCNTGIVVEVNTPDRVITSELLANLRSSLIYTGYEIC